MLSFSALAQCQHPYQQLPSPSETSNPHIQFAKNKGQWPAQVHYSLKMANTRLFFEGNTITYLLANSADMDSLHQRHHSAKPYKGQQFVRYHAYKLQLLNTTPSTKTNIEGSCLHPFWQNFYLGNNPKNWAAKVPLFAELTYTNIYQNIDMRWYASNDEDQLKYDFIVHPGGNTDVIQLQFSGLNNIRINQQGHLELQTSLGKITETAPYVYQYCNGKMNQVACQYALTNNKVVQFVFPDGYDKTQTLFIDPTIIFSTYTGSYADNWGFTATYDSEGHLYAGGTVFDDGYPTTIGAFQKDYGGGEGTLGTDMGITKFSPDGKTLIYSTYLGGKRNELPHSLIVDSQNNLVLFGTTGSNNFPATNGAYDKTFNGGNDVGDISNIPFYEGSDIVVAKFAPEGDLLAATYIGGSDNDGLNIDKDLTYNYADEARGEVFLDANDQIIIASCTWSNDFPVTSGAYQTKHGGSQDGVLIKIKPDLSALVFATYLGGSSADAAYGLKLDLEGNILTAGGTRSSNFPTTAGVINSSYGGKIDGFLSKISADGKKLMASTYLGTNDYDQAYFVEIDDAHEFVYTVGQTSGNYPVTSGVYSNSGSGQFIHKLTLDLTKTEFSTVFGNGNGEPNISPTAFLIDICNRIYVSGWGADSPNFGMPSSFGTNGLVTTSDAYKKTTDGNDFYFFVLTEDAKALEYASFFGGNGSGFDGADEHVDGGTSRFDKAGIVYQAVCAGCGGTNLFPTTSGVWSKTNNADNCNLGAIKFDFQPPIVLADALADPSITGCVPLNVKFTNKSKNATNYFWDFDDNNNTSTLTNPNFTYTKTGVYNVMLVAWDPNACNEADTAYTTITVLDPATLTANFTYELDCETKTVIVTPIADFNGAVSFSWQFGDGQTSTDTIATHTYTIDGNYEITLIAQSAVPGCPGTDTVKQTITIAPNVEAKISGKNGCRPLKQVFGNTSKNGTTFHWDFGIGSATNDTSNITKPQFEYTKAGTYTVTLIAYNPLSCNGSDTATIKIVVKDTLINGNFDIILPDPCDEKLLVKFDSKGAPLTDSFMWQFGDGQTSTSPDPNHIYTQPGTYTTTMIVDNECAPPDTTIKTFTLLPPNFVEVNMTPPQDGCEPVTVQLSGGGNGISYLWLWGDGSSTTEMPPPAHEYSNPGVYQIQLIAFDSTTCNKTDTITAILNVYSYATADFEASTYTSEPGLPILFTNLSTGATNYLWTFGDGNTSNEINPTYSYQTPGEYLVCLTALSPQSCNDSICKTIIVVPPITLGTPNAFTPDGDKLNDTFFVLGREHITQLELRIYNRWGQLVYQTNDPMSGWDGTFKNEPQEMEVYVYTVQAVVKSGRVINFSGNLTLLR
ncbi:MAG: PKD domain-containing protein [Sphingobacteriales bacterium]|nr:PKD domain-containing protein [Sphingobacteriales bacterium]